MSKYHRSGSTTDGYGPDVISKVPGTDVLVQHSISNDGRFHATRAMGRVDWLI